MSVKPLTKRIADLRAQTQSGLEIAKLFAEWPRPQAPLDIGDDLALIFQRMWEARKNYAQEFTELDAVRFCAACRSIGKAPA